MEESGEWSLFGNWGGGGLGREKRSEAVAVIDMFMELLRPL